MTETRMREELDAALATARRWQMLAEQRSADCDKLRAIVESYEASTRRDRERVERLLAKVTALETTLAGSERELRIELGCEVP